jgi:hypothetical protein
MNFPPLQVNYAPFEVPEPPVATAHRSIPSDRVPVFHEWAFREQWPVFQPAGDLGSKADRPADDQAHFQMVRSESTQTPSPGWRKTDFRFDFFA